MKLNGSQILMEVLMEQGVDTIFGYPGGAVLNIYDALYDYKDRIHHVMTAHEQGAAHAADGYARSTGKTGVVFATSGPGATNLVTGIATAYMDSIPMVAITGNVSTDLLGKDSFQEVYITGITMPITKHNYVVRDVNQMADTLRSAFRIAKSGRPGPVLVDIPKDVSAAFTDYTPVKQMIHKKILHYDRNEIEEIAKILNSCKRPVMLFGGGVVASDASEIVREFLKKMSMPGCHTIMGTGVLKHDEPKSLGLIGMHGNIHAYNAVERADILLAVGMRFSDRVATNTGHFAKNSKIIHIDIDPAEINKNISIDYSLVGDVKDVLTELLPLIDEKPRKDWEQEIISLRRESETKIKKTDPVPTPKKIIDDIYDTMGEDIIMTTDVGQHQMWAAQYTRAGDPRHFLTSGGLGTMGYGYGAAIGAATAHPGKHVIHVTGDGSFHMNMNELCTSVSYRLPIITVIFNNRSLGMVYQWQKSFYQSRFCFTLPDRKTNYVMAANAYGAEGARCADRDDFKSALTKAAKYSGPTVIELLLDTDEQVLPMIPAGLTIDDVITE